MFILDFEFMILRFWFNVLSRVFLFAPARVFLTTQAKLNAPARHILSHTLRFFAFVRTNYATLLATRFYAPR